VANALPKACGAALTAVAFVDHRMGRPQGSFKSLLGLCYLYSMTKVEDIERAVSELPADELAKFRAWFEAFEAHQFDEKIERGAKGGKLDRLAEQAIADFRKGRAREL
jgi:hypothetical protein